MKFAMVIVESEEERETIRDAERDFQTLVHWWTQLRSNVNVVASGRLAPRRTAHTVSWRDQVPLVTDGPYIEAKESVGGFLVVDVDSEVEAIEIAKTWPSPVGFKIEVRPLVEPSNGGGV